MFGKAFSFGGLLLLAGAAVLVTPGSGLAQHHGGGGHGGGFHGGFSHGGGFHHGGFSHGGFNHGFHHGGFNHSFNHGFHHDGFHDGFHHGFHHGGWWYPGYYGYYGAWPSYYGSYPYSGYSGYYPYTYSPDWSSPAYDSGYYGSYGGVTPSYSDGYQAYYPPATVAPNAASAQSDETAHVTVSAPSDAEVWFDGTKTTSTGSVREYQSPPLTPGSQYTYEVRARWNENGQKVTQTQQVKVTAGAHISVKFPLQPTKALTAPSH
jgi:uncharacterized protein (TIGR03000 family)